MLGCELLSLCRPTHPTPPQAPALGWEQPQKASRSHPHRFSHELDPPSVKHARAVEEHFIAQWIQEARRPEPSAVRAVAKPDVLGRRGVDTAAAVA